MKKNCQIWKDGDIDSLLKTAKGIQVKNSYIHPDGSYVANGWDEEKKVFSELIEYSIYDLAQMVNMPLWEVIMIDNGGFDDYAILFYEEN